MFKKLFSNTIVKVFSLNSLIVFGKLISSFVVSKVSAIYLGPSGYAIVGNFKNVLQGVLGITANGFESGIIKYTAENKNNDKQFNIIVSSAITLSIIISFIIGIILMLFANSLSTYVLKDAAFAFVFRYLAILLPLVSLNFLIVYILNGLQKLKLYSILLTLTNSLNAILSFIFIYFLDLEGALLASIIIPALSFIFSLLFNDVRNILTRFFLNVKLISINVLKSISIYIAMATYSSLLISLTYLFIRNEIISNLGIDTAGLWEAMNRISAFYMVFFSSLFTLYLLPQLAINKTIAGYYQIMKTYFKYVIPFTIVLLAFVFVFRILIIKIFLTDAFVSIEKLVYLQLIGDFIKIIAFSIAYQFHAKKMVVFYFITDAILYVSFYILSIIFINYFNLEGVFYAYIISTLAYLIAVSLFVYLNNENSLKEHV
ncbi:MAG: O-antigen translocase [Flaviramulus sp.]|nr:O-antigen translocase [Flaviramulus sp.]NNC51082.1 O-antigen translocase [Flaviramulus sp.]